MFLKGLGKISPDEQIMYNYWFTNLALLELGIPWEAIQQFTSAEMAVILGVSNAKQERQQEAAVQQERMMANQMRR